MRYRCANCGEIFYTRESMVDCPQCQVQLEKAKVKGEKIECPVSGETPRSVRGIPNCEHFTLTKAVGSRCTFGEFPSRCRICSLPFYNPRVGAQTKRAE